MQDVCVGCWLLHEGRSVRPREFGSNRTEIRVILYCTFLLKSVEKVRETVKDAVAHKYGHLTTVTLVTDDTVRTFPILFLMNRCLINAHHFCCLFPLPPYAAGCYQCHPVSTCFSASKRFFLSAVVTQDCSHTPRHRHHYSRTLIWRHSRPLQENTSHTAKLGSTLCLAGCGKAGSTRLAGESQPASPHTDGLRFMAGGRGWV